MNISNIAILNIQDSDYHCITGLRKGEAINLLHYIDSTEKRGT